MRLSLWLLIDLPLAPSHPQAAAPGPQSAATGSTAELFEVTVRLRDVRTRSRTMLTSDLNGPLQTGVEKTDAAETSSPPLSTPLFDQL